MLAYITKIVLVLFSSLHEWIAGGFNHPRFTNSSWFRTFAPVALMGMTLALGTLTSHYLDELNKTEALQKEIDKLQVQLSVPSKELSENSVLLATCKAQLEASDQRYKDLDRSFQAAQTENAALRERLLKDPEPVKPKPPEVKKNDSILESSNRRLKRLGDKKDDPTQ